MSKLHKFVLVRLVAAGISIASVSVLANKEDTSMIESDPSQMLVKLEKIQTGLHDKLTLQPEGAAQRPAGKAKLTEQDRVELFGTEQ